MYIDSSNISIFPLAKNRPSDRSARLFYEDNVANLIRQVVDVEGFLISKEPLALSITVAAGKNNLQKISIVTGNSLVFNLYGYYFSIDKGSVIYCNDEVGTNTSTIESPLYAILNIDASTNEIVGADNAANEYEGLHISSDLQQCGSNGHYLKLLDFKATRNSNGQWTITSELCNASYQKISSSSLDMSISRIDGKH